MRAGFIKTRGKIYEIDRLNRPFGNLKLRWLANTGSPQAPKTQTPMQQPQFPHEVPGQKLGRQQSPWEEALEVDSCASPWPRRSPGQTWRPRREGSRRSCTARYRGQQKSVESGKWHWLVHIRFVRATVEQRRETSHGIIGAWQLLSNGDNTALAKPQLSLGAVLVNDIHGRGTD